MRRRPRKTVAASLAVSEFSKPPRTVSQDLLDLFDARFIYESDSSVHQLDQTENPMLLRLKALERGCNGNDEKFRGYEQRLTKCDSRISQLERELRDRDELLQSCEQKLHTCKQRLSCAEDQLALHPPIPHTNEPLVERHDRQQARELCGTFNMFVEFLSVLPGT